jgi:hypothetical protein
MFRRRSQITAGRLRKHDVHEVHKGHDGIFRDFLSLFVTIVTIVAIVLAGGTSSGQWLSLIKLSKRQGQDSFDAGRALAACELASVPHGERSRGREAQGQRDRR